MMSREDFANTNWKMTYEEYAKCYCPDCTRENCKHREAYRRVPVIDGGLGLCPNLKCEYKVREYYKTGLNKGDTKSERYFKTKEEADEYYNSVFVYDDYALNPTVWHFENGDWHRIYG